MTKIQEEVAEVMGYLKPITERQTEWIQHKPFRHYALKYSEEKQRCNCCGSLMPVGLKKCPKCGEKFYGSSYMGKGTLKAYVMIMNTCRGWQVFRLFQLSLKHRRAGFDRSVYEVAQTWINPKGKRVILSTGFCPMSSAFNVHNPLTFRRVRTYSTYYINQYAFEDYTDFYPSQRVLPEFRKYHLTKGMNVMNVVHYLLACLKGDTLVETLAKCGQFHLASDMMYSKRIPEHCVKLALRHNYIVKDSRMWYDYINDLEELGMDTHNPSIVLPKNLRLAHHNTTMRLEKIRERQAEERRYLDSLKTAEAKNKEYKKMKEPFLGIKFDNGQLFVHVLSSVREFMEEGKAMSHCVSRYWKEADSLIMSARNEKDERLETIEVNLTSFKIVQSRGHCNQPSAFHDSIVNLVNQNMQKIRTAAGQRKHEVLKKS